MESPVVHHLLLCRRASYDLNDAVTPYSLHRLAFMLRPRSGSGYPFVVSKLWLFARLEGEESTDFWVDVIYATDAEDDVGLVATYGPLTVHFGDEAAPVSRAWRLRGVPFPGPGWYEFRLKHAGESLASEWIYLED